MKKEHTIGVKLMTGVAGLLAAILLLGYFSVNSIGNLGDEVQTAANVTGKKMEMAADIGAAVDQMRIQQNRLVMFAQLKQKARSEQAETEFRAADSKLAGLIAQLKPMLHIERAVQAIADIETRLPAWRSAQDQVAALCASQTFDEQLTNKLDESVATAAEVGKDVAALMQVENELFASSAAEGIAEAGRGRWIAGILIALSLAVAGVVMWLVRQITGKLRSAVGDLGESARQVASAAGQVASASQSLAQGASQQAASIEETSASSEEINSMAHKNTENSRAAASLVGSAREQFVDANRSLEEMVVAMGEIKSSSDKISKIIKTIDEIAFQTNILALNAAVEAARAGEAGMGFAVVADEVRNLAQRSAQAARDTASLIEESIRKSNEGQSKVDHVAASIRSITGETEKVNLLVDEVNVGSQEQTRGIEQVAKAIAQMDQLTQRNAASAQQSASAAEELTAQSQALMDVVSTLGAMVGRMEREQEKQHVAPPMPAAQTVQIGGRPAQRGDDAFPLE